MSILSIDFISDQSKKNLEEVPQNVLQMYNLKMLYLEGNAIDRLPEDFFPNLQKLTWLDLRNNLLKSIPQNIAFHPNLENLLLGNNRIQYLPNQLGLVPRLKVLQIAGNPIKYPSDRILSQGVKVICGYLRDEYKKMQPIRENDDEDDYEDEPHRENLHASINRHKKMTVQQLLQQAVRRATRQTGDWPSIRVRRLKAPKPATILNESVAATSRSTKPSKIHKLTKSYSKLSLHSSINSSRRTTPRNFESIREGDVKELWLNKLRELLLDQEKILQQEKNLRTLNNWRLKKKNEPPKRKTVEHVIVTPYDTNPDYNQLISRNDLTKEVEEIIKQKRLPQKKPEVQKLISEVVSRLKALEAPREDLSPRSEIEQAASEIQSIMELHRKISSIRSSTDSFQ